ncbi:MAG: hypothetical protein ACXV47_04890 [Halobacteriota archaeon]
MTVMERFKRLCFVGSVFSLVFVLLQSTASAQAFEPARSDSPDLWHGISPLLSIGSNLQGTRASFVTPFFSLFAGLDSSVVGFAQQFSLHVTAQYWSVVPSDIPEVLTPSLEAPPEPSLYVPTEAPSVTPTLTNATNVTTPLTEQNDVSLEKLLSGIPLVTVALLAPILIIIGVLFYSLLKVEQEDELSAVDEDSEVEPARVGQRSRRVRYWRKRHTKR